MTVQAATFKPPAVAAVDVASPKVNARAPVDPQGAQAEKGASRNPPEVPNVAAKKPEDAGAEIANQRRRQKSDPGEAANPGPTGRYVKRGSPGDQTTKRKFDDESRRNYATVLPQHLKDPRIVANEDWKGILEAFNKQQKKQNEKTI